ncbi:hypothetical protein GGI42DRAFT_337337, partial [Trichoderma sp. SZMC 28013]
MPSILTIVAGLGAFELVTTYEDDTVPTLVIRRLNYCLGACARVVSLNQEEVVRVRGLVGWSFESVACAIHFQGLSLPFI